MYVQPATLRRIVPHGKQKPLEYIFVAERYSKMTAMPPFMTEEGIFYPNIQYLHINLDGPNWRKYYWYRDLQANVWDSRIFALFEQLNITGDMFGITEGVRNALLTAILVALDPDDDREFFDRESLYVDLP